MLTIEESGWHFETIKIYSALNILPIQVDGKSGKIQRQSSKIRIFLWKLLFCIATADCFFLMGRLVQSTILEPEKYFRWDHFVLHVPFATGYTLMCYIGFQMFCKNPEECAMVFNQLFVEREDPVQKTMDEIQEPKLKIKSGRKSTKRARKCEAWIELESTKVSVEDSAQNQTSNSVSDLEETPKSGSGSPVESSLRVRPLLAWPPQYSLDEILARTFARLLIPTQFFVMAVFAIDLDRPQFWYSVLPSEYQNWYTFLGLLLVEAIFLAVAALFACFSIVCQLLFFGKCQAEFKRLNLQLRGLKDKFQGCSSNHGNGSGDLRREMWILRQILGEMRELVVFIELFNRCFPFCIFAFKLICFNCILLYFFTIRHGQDFVFLGIFTGYGSIVVTLIYGILYQKAFSIPEKMEQLKKDFLLSALKTTTKSTTENGNLNFWSEMKREIKKIHGVGIKVGSFHTLERETTPRFVDFVVKNVVNLLVTFPR